MYILQININIYLYFIRSFSVVHYSGVHLADLTLSVASSLFASAAAVGGLSYYKYLVSSDVSGGPSGAAQTALSHLSDTATQSTTSDIAPCPGAAVW